MRRRLAGLVAALAALASPLVAAVVVESVRAPASAVSPLRAGDVVLRWRSAGAAAERQGELEHWGDLELLPLVEGPRGELELELRRDGEVRRETLVPGHWILRDRPLEVDAATLDLVGSFAADGPEIAADELAERLAGADAEVASWAWARYAGARARKGDWPGAVDGYTRAAAAARGPIAAELETASGNASRRLGHLDAAEAAYRRALALWQRIEPDGLGASLPLNALGNLYAARYELAEASRYFREATRIRRKLAPDSWLFANALNSLGTLAGRRNDLAAAEGYLLEALAIYERTQGDLAPALANLGVVARLRGDLERSEMYTKRALALYRAAGAQREAADKLINLGNVLGDARRWDEAIAAYSEAQALLESGSSDVESLATAWTNRAHVLQRKGDLDAAGRAAEAAHELLGFDRPRTSLEAYTAEVLRDQAEALDDLGEAARWGELSLEARARTQPDSSFEALAASALARIRVRQGRPAEAETLFRRSIDALELQQRRLGGGDRGLVAFRAKYAAIYRDYVAFLLRTGRVNDAFELYERSRASALLALLGQRDLDFAAGDVSPERARERRELALELDRAYAALARLPADAAADRERQRQELERLHAQREALDRTIRAASPRVAAAEAPPALGVDAIRAALPPGTLLLAYQLGPERSTLFSLAREGGLEAHSIATGEEAIAADVRALLERLDGGLLARRERAAIEARLARTLLAPVAGRLDAAQRLLVVPDGALHALAFAALPDPRDASRRLVEALPVTHQVSASVFAALQARATTEAIESVAVFADPASSAPAAARYRRDFGRLPAARREAELVSGVFSDRTRVFVDRSATETAARRELGSATISHFACHAAVDEALPLDSALVLSAEAGDEGLLQAWEIAEQVEIGSGLVVLSACETARGAERGGEGILGLVRAFQVAGARAVLASLWRVDDESAAELMGRFYAGVAEGLPRDEALRRAQLAFLAGPIQTVRDGREIALDASDPRHWAPFVLIGPVD